MLYGRCVQCDVSPARMALFTFCVMRHDSITPHFWGLRTPAGGYDPQIWSRPRSLCSASTPNFHHPMFTRSEVIVFTYKPTHKQTNRFWRKHPTFFATLRRLVKTRLTCIMHQLAKDTSDLFNNFPRTC